MLQSGKALLQAVAERIVVRYLGSLPETETVPMEEVRALGQGVDLAYVSRGLRKTVMVKPDVYFGADPAKAADRMLPLYRGDLAICALQSVADSTTHDPGWMLTSDADELFYYFLAIPQREAEIRDILAAPDDSFFARLKVERDDLLVFPMEATRAWFVAQAERLQSRPIALGGSSAWYRLAPRVEIENAVRGASDHGPIFMTLAS